MMYVYLITVKGTDNYYVAKSFECVCELLEAMGIKLDFIQKFQRLGAVENFAIGD